MDLDFPIIEGVRRSGGFTVGASQLTAHQDSDREGGLRILPRRSDVELWIARGSSKPVSVVLDSFFFGSALPCDGSQYRYMRQTHSPNVGALTLFEPGEAVVTVRNVGGVSFFGVSVPQGIVEGCFFESGAARKAAHFRTGRVQSEATVASMRAAWNALQAHSMDCLEEESVLCEFLLPLIDHFAEEQRSPGRAVAEKQVRRVRERIDDDFAAPLSLDELAAEVGLTKYHLERKFREHVGLPIHRYRKHVRVARALERLRAGHSLSDVAAAVGFCDQPHMNRVFRQTLGMTPKYYATQYARRGA